MDEPAQEGPCRQHHGAAAERPPVSQRHAGDDAIGNCEIDDLAFDNLKTRLCLDRRAHRLAIELAVGLSSRPAHRRTLAAVEQAKLDPGCIRDPAHQPVERVDLTNQVTLAEATDRRIAGHHTDGVGAERDQRGRGAAPCSRGGGLAAGMPAADHNDIETLLHGLFQAPADVLPFSPQAEIVKPPGFT